MSNLRQRAWLFTLNNYVEEDMNKLKSLPSVKFYVIGREVGKNGTPHLQGYIYFVHKKSFKALKELHSGAHWEAARGTAQENYAYCTKEGNFVTDGVMPLDPTEKGAKGAARVKELWSLAIKGEFRSLPPGNIKTWEYIHQKYKPHPSDRDTLQNLWIYGPSGSGKSSYVRKTYPTFFTKSMSKWWDGYNNEQVVVLDDFDPEHGKYLSYYLKIWADHYHFNAEVKGGSYVIRPQIIIVTSQYNIVDCFLDHKAVEAVSRRFIECDIRCGESSIPVFQENVEEDQEQMPLLEEAAENEELEDGSYAQAR